MSSIFWIAESTSALDSKTERLVMNAINEVAESLTVIIVAHRVSTLSTCDIVIELKNGEISYSGSYESLLAKLNNWVSI